MKRNASTEAASLAIVCLFFAGGGGGNGNNNVGTPAGFTVGGTVSGLSDTGPSTPIPADSSP